MTRQAELRGMVAEATPGPWGWFGNAGNNSIYLATIHSGRRFVMDFVRWGMRGAQPRFQTKRNIMVDAKDLLQFEVGDKSVVGVDAARKDESVYRLDIRGVDSADARLIAQAPTLATDLADALDREAALREALEWYGEQARLCRLVHSEGDAGRQALSDDGGQRARAALGAKP